MVTDEELNLAMRIAVKEHLSRIVLAVDRGPSLAALLRHLRDTTHQSD